MLVPTFALSPTALEVSMYHNLQDLMAVSQSGGRWAELLDYAGRYRKRS